MNRSYYLIRPVFAIKTKTGESCVYWKVHTYGKLIKYANLPSAEESCVPRVHQQAAKAINMQKECRCMPCLNGDGYWGQRIPTERRSAAGEVSHSRGTDRGADTRFLTPQQGNVEHVPGKAGWRGPFEGAPCLWGIILIIVPDCRLPVWTSFPQLLW